MKKLIYTVVCMMLFCCACSDADIELNPATQAKQQLAMTFRCGAMSPTRAATNDTRIDDINLYLFPVNGGQARHVYIAPVRPVVLELPKEALVKSIFTRISCAEAKIKAGIDNRKNSKY